MTVIKRCEWVTNEQIYIEYHDKEWGQPVFNDQKLFEMLVLEGAQAGLSWITILRKRKAYQLAFDYFDVHKVANYSETKIQDLLNDSGIVRNERKIRSAINNARAFIRIQEEFGSFSTYLWSYVESKPIINYWNAQQDVPTETLLSQTISQDLKRRGFNFVGPTIIYSYMQAVGLVNDHVVDCICHPINE